MELDCVAEYGICHDIIKKCRTDWSLAHDVNLLKYLEHFSQSLISRTGEALLSLENFENDLNSLSLNIRSVSQRFQSLANKQFIEHCVLEDDISTYAKQQKNSVEVQNSASNVKLNKALASCLSSFHGKHNIFREDHSAIRSNYGSCMVQGMHHLPSLIGSPQFNDYYAVLLNEKTKLKESMQYTQVNNVSDNSSDKQSLQDSISLHSSNVALDDDGNPFIGNHIDVNEVDPTTSSISGDVDDSSTHGLYSSVISSIKHRGAVWGSQDNLFEKIERPCNISSNPSLFEDTSSVINNSTSPETSQSIIIGKDNRYNSVTDTLNNQQSTFLGYDKKGGIDPPKAQSLFDDDNDDADNIFSFAKPKIVSANLFTNENDETNSQLKKKSVASILGGGPQKTVVNPSVAKRSNDNKLSCSSDEVPSKHQKSLRNNQNSIQRVESNQNCSGDQNLINNFDTHLDESTSCMQIEAVFEEQNSLDKKNSGSDSCKILDTQQSLFSSSTKIDGDDSFTLFSDHENSDEELFSSSKHQNLKENFKRILEQKMSALSIVKNVSNFNGKLNKNKYDNFNHEENTRSDESAEKNDGDNKDDSLLPNYDTSTLHSLVKTRPRIRNKRRPPSRKHLKGSQSLLPSNSEAVENQNKLNNVKTPVEEASNAVSILSPSTEEEDLFVVPSLSMVHEVSSSNLFLASSLLSPGYSLDSNIFPDDANDSIKIDDKSNNSNQMLTNYENASSSGRDQSLPSLSPLVQSAGDMVCDKKSVGTNEPSKLLWSNNESLFNDSDEDDDDLFSNNKKLIFTSKKTPAISIDRNSIHSNHNQLNNDLFKDIFSNNSDDDDLFKIAESSMPSGTKIKSASTSREKGFKSSEINGGNLIKSNSRFKDPLSCFEDNHID